MPEPLEQLDAAFRSRQVRLQAGAAATVARMHRGIGLDELVRDDSPVVEAWLSKSELIVQTLRRQSVVEAQSYYEDVRTLAVGRVEPFERPTIAPIDSEQLRTSLYVTGVVNPRKAIADAPPKRIVTNLDALLRARYSSDTPTLAERASRVLEVGQTAALDEAVRTASDGAGAAAGRHVANGAREYVDEASQRDRRAIGWVRVTNGQPCFFCAALASRGPVYSGDSFDESDARFMGPGQHKVHDGCACSLRQVYTRGHEEWPALSQEFETRWWDLAEETKKRFNRRPTMLDWRRHYEGRALVR